MHNILIFGNSGSGKSSLAKQLCQRHDLAHLDLDSIAWLPQPPPQRVPLVESEAKLHQFMNSHKGWVIEGCYTDLLELAAAKSNQIIFLRLSQEACINNATKRPWEPHKYPSKRAQDANLEMLKDWICQYSKREDTFSLSSHQQFYNNYPGKKTLLSNNLETEHYGNNG